MTALTEYARLEATAIWRPAPDAQRRDVFVSLGDATLIIHDGKDVALAHWSLPAITRRNPGRSPARYAPGEDAPEELEIADETMVSAIERVRSAVLRQTPKPGRLRHWLIAAFLALGAGLAVFWAPAALIRQTAAIVPSASRTAIGGQLLDALRPMTGPSCATPQGTRALAALRTRLLPDGAFRIVVLPEGIETIDHIPGGNILVGRTLVEDFEAPDVLAGYILAEAERMRQTDPLGAMLTDLGVGSAFRLLTTGTVSQEALKLHARNLVARGSAPPPDAGLLAPRFAEAAVQMSPYAYAMDITGETTLALIEAEAAAGAPARPILSDDNWVALQNICGP